MTNKKLIIIGAAVLVAAVAGFYLFTLSRKRGLPPGTKIVPSATGNPDARDVHVGDNVAQPVFSPVTVDGQIVGGTG